MNLSSEIILISNEYFFESILIHLKIFFNIFYFLWNIRINDFYFISEGKELIFLKFLKMMKVIIVPILLIPPNPRLVISSIQNY